MFRRGFRSPYRRPYSGFRRGGANRFQAARVVRLWAQPTWDTVPTVLANAAVNYQAIPAYSASLAADPRDIADDYIVERVVGRVFHYVGANPGATGTGVCLLHSGIAVAETQQDDQTPSDVARYDPSNPGDNPGVRWLWTRKMLFTGLSSSGSIPVSGGTYTSDTVLPDGSWIDFSPRVRLRQQQQLMIFTNPVNGAGMTGSVMRQMVLLRVLIRRT